MNFPRLSARGRYGLIFSIVSAFMMGMFRAVVTGRPLNTLTTCSATMTATLIWASLVDAPRCGVTMTFGCSSSGLPTGGSFSKTSSAAPATLPDLNASSNAASSMMPPRAQLMIRTPFFIFSNWGVEIMCLVSGMRGV